MAATAQALAQALGAAPDLWPSDPGYVQAHGLLGGLIPRRAKAGPDGTGIAGTGEWAWPSLPRDLVNSVHDAVTLPGDVYSGARPATTENALNLATMLTGGAGAVPMEANALRAGAGLSKKAQLAELMSRWQQTSVKPAVIQAYEKGLPVTGAEQMAVAHPNTFGPYTNVKPNVPESEFSAKYKMLKGMDAPRAVFDPAELENAHVIPLLADSSRAGGTLTQLNGQKLNVKLHGGPRYAEANAAQGSGAAWANQPSPAGTVRSQIREGLEKGKRVIGLTVNGAPTTADQSTMASEIALQRLRQAPLKNKDLRELDAAAKDLMPGWPGINHPKAMEFLQGQLQPVRKSWIESLETAPRVAQGVPDVNQGRLALTEPGLRQAPAGAAGFAAMEFGPESLQPHAPTLEHPTYKSQIAGKPLGGMERMVPYNLVAPEVYAARRVAGDPIGSDFKSMTQRKWGGSITPESFDAMMSYLEHLKETGQ